MSLFPCSIATTCNGLVSGRYTTVKLGKRLTVQNRTGSNVISSRLDPSIGCRERLWQADKMADSTRLAARTLSSAMKFQMSSRSLSARGVNWSGEGIV